MTSERRPPHKGRRHPFIACLTERRRRWRLRKEEAEFSCLYCDRPYGDTKYWPYCCQDCAARADGR